MNPNVNHTNSGESATHGEPLLLFGQTAHKRREFFAGPDSSARPDAYEHETHKQISIAD